MDEHSNDIRQSRLLIIDDEPANLELLEELFAEEGFEQVLSSVDARRISSLLQGFRPDIVLLDLRMPEVDGFSVLVLLDDLREQGEWIPVIVLTADITREARYKALSLGHLIFLPSLSIGWKLYCGCATCLKPAVSISGLKPWAKRPLCLIIALG